MLLAASFTFIAAAHGADPAPALQTLMKDGAAPLSEQLWGLANRAVDDEGKPDASLMTAGEWRALADHARSMKAVAEAMMDAASLKVTEDGAALGDGVSSGASAQMVAGYIEGEPALFEQYARDLAASADAFEAAARTRDAARLMEASDSLGMACESCHAKFWYPEQ